MSVVKGFYRHYKGPLYYVLGVGCLKHEDDRRIVIYTSVRTEEGREGFDFLARDEVDFERWVEPDGTERPELDGDEGANARGLIRRFEHVTDEEGSMVLQSASRPQGSAGHSPARGQPTKAAGSSGLPACPNCRGRSGVDHHNRDESGPYFECGYCHHKWRRGPRVTLRFGPNTATSPAITATSVFRNDDA